MKAIIPKKVSNYELFFDLVFVFAVSVLTGMMHGNDVHLTLHSYLQFGLGFIMLTKLWYHETLYLNKYGERDLTDIVTIILNMFAIGYMANELTLDWQQTYVSFNSLFLLSNASVLLQYFLRGRKIGRMSQTMWSHMKDILVDMLIQMTWFALLLVGIKVPIFWVYVLYGFSLLFVYLTRDKKEEDKANFPHLVERLQLITIIYFGEAIMASIRAFDLDHHLLEALLSFASIGLMFIAYITETAVMINHNQQKTGLRLFYVQTVLLFGVLLTTLMIEMAETPHHFPDAKMLGMLGLVLIYLSVQLLAPYNRSNLRLTPKWALLHLLALALPVLAIGFLSHSIISLLVLSFVTGLGQFIITIWRLNVT